MKCLSTIASQWPPQSNFVRFMATLFKTIVFISAISSCSTFELPTSTLRPSRRLSGSILSLRPNGLTRASSVSSSLTFLSLSQRKDVRSLLQLASSATNSDNSSKRRFSPRTSNKKNTNNNPRNRKFKNRNQSNSRPRNPNFKPRKHQNTEEAKKSLMEEFKTKLKDMQKKSQNNETMTQEYFDEIMGLSVAANDWDEVLNILEIMKANNVSQQLSTYRACLNQCYRVSNIDSAISILDAMDQANVRPEGKDIGTVISILCKLGNWRRSLNIVKQYTEKQEQFLQDDNTTVTIIDQDSNQTEIELNASKYVIPVERYNAIIFNMGRSKNWKEAIQLLSLMENNPRDLHPEPQLYTYNLVLEACSQASQPEQAMQILQSIASTKKDMSPNTHSYNLVISACLKKQQWRRAIQILEMMNESDPPVPQTTVTYNSVISCCAKAGEVHHAMSLLKMMRLRKVKPDTVTYNALMSACASSYKTCDNALKLLDELHREPGVDPDVVTYTIAMRACAKGGKTQRGLAMFQMMKDRNLDLDVHAYTSAMDVCAKAGMWRQSLDLLDEMREKGIFPNGFTYSVAIAACGKGGQWERALELLYQMREKGIHINTITYNAAISALASASTKNMRQILKEERSKEYLSRVMEDGEGFSSTTSYPSTSFGKSENSQLWRKALNLIDQMKETGVQPDAISYSSAIKTCGAAGRWKEALEIISIMKKGGPLTRPNRISYTNAITACGRCGEYEHALSLFDDMKNSGVQPDRVSYNALISALKAANQEEKIFQLWNEMCGTSYVGEDGDSKKDTVIATATPDARKIAPDIITVTDVIDALERSPNFRSKSDIVFAEAVKRNLLFKTDTYSLDTVWEVDLSGMSFPVAHTAVRYALKRAHASFLDDGVLEDLTFITGTGSTFSSASTADDRGVKKDTLTEGYAPVALREFIRESLRNEFEPSIETTIPSYAPGTIITDKETFKKWIEGKPSPSIS